ncbi:protein kinase [Nocardia sp. NPDC050710]|uniref:serine/threonine-protein kinase n=1 Tax=Nocardia sp. NPDC050710 TaxID=3157220 RepID=UPI0033C6B970
MDDAESRVGSRFGPYELRSLLGRGGMGEVYEAYDTVKDRVVAVKLLPPDLAEDPVFQQRFRLESQAAARLAEPHVIPIHDWGEIDGVLYIDMRLVRGSDLRSVLRQKGPLSPVRAVGIIEQIAAALDAAHAEGLVHRDVKPANILVTPSDFAYLADFGIARSTGDPNVTATGTAVGSYNYIAPERFDTAPVTGTADVYSLACVLYECLTGAQPFPVDAMSVLIRSHLTAPPPRPTSKRAGLPAALDDVITRGMAKDPADRYPSASALAAAARAAVTAPPPTPDSELPTRRMSTVSTPPAPPTVIFPAVETTPAQRDSRPPGGVPSEVADRRITGGPAPRPHPVPHAAGGGVRPGRIAESGKRTGGGSVEPSELARPHFAGIGPARPGPQGAAAPTVDLDAMAEGPAEPSGRGPAEPSRTRSAGDVLARETRSRTSEDDIPGDPQRGNAATVDLAAVGDEPTVSGAVLRARTGRSAEPATSDVSGPAGGAHPSGGEVPGARPGADAATADLAAVARAVSGKGPDMTKVPGKGVRAGTPDGAVTGRSPGIDGRSGPRSDQRSSGLGRPAGTGSARPEAAATKAAAGQTPGPRGPAGAVGIPDAGIAAPTMEIGRIGSAPIDRSSTALSSPGGDRARPDKAAGRSGLSGHGVAAPEPSIAGSAAATTRLGRIDDAAVTVQRSAIAAPVPAGDDPPSGKTGRSRRGRYWFGALLVVAIALAGLIGWQVRSGSPGGDPTPPNIPATSVALPDGAQRCAQTEQPIGRFTASAAGTSVTSCPFAEALRTAYAESAADAGVGDQRTVTATSPINGREYSMHCTAGAEFVTCTGGVNAIVYIY